MGVLTQEKINNDVFEILTNIEKHQYAERKIDMDKLKSLPILTREGLQNTKMEMGFISAKTSGSTGEPLVIQKSYADYIWFIACNLLDLRWKDWDLTKNVAIINPAETERVIDGWGFPKNIVPTQGKMLTNGYKTISELQEWLERVNPEYISCYPSIFKEIDTSKITNFLDWKGTGELGGNIYSSNECGIIALECPENKGTYHVMDNQIIEVDDDGGMIITTLTNPYVRRYKHGDHIELGECTCGRTSQVITKINGRVRNMFKLENGDKKWPLIGSLEFTSYGIKRFRCIQQTYNDIELQIIAEPLGNREEELKELLVKMLDVPVNVNIKYVTEFKDYKHEEFISLV